MTTVLFVGGVGRSGSTLLTRALGSLPGFTSVGETYYLWDEGVLRNATCGCWNSFSECPFWTEVGQAAFGGWRRDEAERLRQLRRTHLRTRYVPALMSTRRTSGFEAAVRDYAASVSSLYAGLDEVTGGDIIVDSSKYPSAAYLLPFLENVKAYVLHLVRDSRGVAYSWSKSISNPDNDGEFPRISFGRTSVDWLVHNAMLASVSRVGLPRLLLRYPDFVSDPRSSLESVARFVGRPLSDRQIAHVGSGGIVLGTDHIAVGNYMKFRSGFEEIRLDEEWRDRLPRGPKTLVTTVTAPGLFGYGFLRAGSHPQRAVSW